MAENPKGIPMQIDGHHTMTYIAARLAGYGRRQAAVIAYSAQYVDDATNSGVINFSNNAMYRRISSAHKMLDYRNSDELANHQVWVPFHFLPGNGGKPAGENPRGSFIRKLVCFPDSYVARDMLRSCARHRDKPYALHRLGITMHVYADTWAHQGFAGVNHKINKVKNLASDDAKLDKNYINKVANYFLSESFPLGHGAALSYPDKPWLIWKYRNGLGDTVARDNSAIFIEAVDKMCRAMRCFRQGDVSMTLESVEGLPPRDSQKMLALIKSIKGDSGEARHQRWLNEIAKGSFSFGSETVKYIAKGRGSWKHKSIGQLAWADTGREQFAFKNTFLNSDWKCFHDALQAHQLDVLHDVLPRYGICAA
ncbi:hypothetical protein MIB92_05400 [Aestuariirhabdus sp. Z084]|uniref:DUF6765 family protein n=1 Tax=Aestuariirhabdus haliotis TaxID=2918751 RepID=UPI00201B4203|nr:DUF6765 family protein [Aestuariirhabdus haliotis]MCL6415077.1 hypothetical protein [Aestuariirhabdus haliotis]MCL6419009.1 hypothetical protein [Aestuariirhabdus haliotis]